MVNSFEKKESNSSKKNKELDTHRFISIPIERPIKTASYRVDISRDFYESDLYRESSVKGVICDGILRELIKRDSVRITELTSSHSDVVTFEGTLEYLESNN